MGRPYIGVTGFMTRDEVEAVLEVVPHWAHRQLMVGVLASTKTLSGQKNKWPNRYPKVEEISNIFVADPRVFNIIHFNTDQRDYFDEELLKLTELAGRCLDGFQFNMTWPPYDIVRLHVRKCPWQRIVLQVGHRALELAGDHSWVTFHVMQYERLINDVLIDASGGRGMAFDPLEVARYVRALREKGFEKGIGFAGGLSSETLDLAEPLLKEFSDLSVDAEGKLRDAEDHLDIEKARDYVRGAFEMTRR